MGNLQVYMCDEESRSLSCQSTNAINFILPMPQFPIIVAQSIRSHQKCCWKPRIDPKQCMTSTVPVFDMSCVCTMGITPLSHYLLSQEPAMYRYKSEIFAEDLPRILSDKKNSLTTSLRVEANFNFDFCLNIFNFKF